MGEGGKLTEDKYSLSGCSMNSHDTDSCTDARIGLASIRVFVGRGCLLRVLAG